MESIMRNYFMNKEEATSTISAILAINSDAQVTISRSYDSGEETIDWGNTVEVSQTDIDAKKVELGEEYDANQYQRDRKPEYPSMADQLDYIYHNGIAKWKSDMVKPVKDAHPKP